MAAGREKQEFLAPETPAISGFHLLNRVKKTSTNDRHHHIAALWQSKAIVTKEHNIYASITALIARESGQALEKVTADIDRDYWMSATEAKEYGLVSRIIVKQGEPG